jgi:hypothetical protein
LGAQDCLIEFNGFSLNERSIVYTNKRLRELADRLNATSSATDRSCQSNAEADQPNAEPVPASAETSTPHRVCQSETELFPLRADHDSAQSGLPQLRGQRPLLIETVLRESDRSMTDWIGLK